MAVECPIKNKAREISVSKKKIPLTDGSRDIMRTVWSANPTAKNLERCSPGGTVPKLMQTISAAISFLSVYSFNWPLYYYHEETSRGTSFTYVY